MTRAMGREFLVLASALKTTQSSIKQSYILKYEMKLNQIALRFSHFTLRDCFADKTNCALILQPCRCF